MPGFLSRSLGWRRYAVVVAVLHILGLFGLFSIAREHSALWSIGLLAYSLGLRHAFDIDHIAAIDNTVRKLTQQKRNPAGVGFYFSLGHSTVVFLLVAAVFWSVKWVQSEIPQLQKVGGMIGMAVSGTFLLLIGFINLIILIQLFQAYQSMRKGTAKHEQLDQLLHNRGLISRLIQPLFRFISRSWHVYPLGFLFGLGFDTASEIALLSVSATTAQSAISFAGVLSLPLLFAAGMSLMDTADGLFMTSAYRWSLSNPLKKMYYNFTVTTISVAAALIVGILELSQSAALKLNLNGAFWSWLQQIDLGDLGYILVGVFVFAWILSVSLWKLLRLEEKAGFSDT